MDPLGTYESPAAFVRRTGLGVDRAWHAWNAYYARRGVGGMTRTQFRFEAKQQASGK